MLTNNIILDIEESIIDSGKDTRYSRDAYGFILSTLEFHHSKTSDVGHIPASELAQSVAELAIMKYGPMAKSVLEHWGIRTSFDVGTVVYNLIELGILAKDEEDSLDDFAQLSALFSPDLIESMYSIDKKEIKILKDA